MLFNQWLCPAVRLCWTSVGLWWSSEEMGKDKELWMCLFLTTRSLYDQLHSERKDHQLHKELTRAVASWEEDTVPDSRSMPSPTRTKKWSKLPNIRSSLQFKDYVDRDNYRANFLSLLLYTHRQTCVSVHTQMDSPLFISSYSCDLFWKTCQPQYFWGTVLGTLLFCVSLMQLDWYLVSLHYIFGHLGAVGPSFDVFRTSLPQKVSQCAWM